MGHLTSAELSRATLAIVKLVQHAEFEEELHCIKTGSSLNTSSKLLALCPLSWDPNDLSPFTSSHFLTGSALTAIPEPDLITTLLSRLGRWQLIQSPTQSFWKRWSKEYIARLQQRPKWYVSQSNISVNDLALIKNELTPPLKWRLARVLRLHLGKDEKVRVVTLKTVRSTYPSYHKTL
jgi:hypothetical protein